ncbi:alpha/beta hydrolase domain-containing protein [Methylocystis sp.]|uniref:alpha/beta hydrolase domain-containing protein n=1 Tax=Methylocystis sp. TaxID=1911079 RepID=UPI0027377A39|nr:alpha/beta hydrolase domain-containing protein [Methylocystis sp.]MDP3553870.1 alpha/beta hydrolase domain-containing protein [Methylocystis sp.]
MALVASLALVSAAHAELLKFETRPDGANEAVVATVKLDGMSHEIAGAFAKPAKPPSGAKALLIETQPSDDLKPLALERGLAVLTLDVAKLPDKARAPALRDVLGHLRGALKMKRVLGRAQGSDADAMSDASSAFDGLLLHDSSREPAAPTRFMATWGADAYWREKPRVEFANAAPANGRRFYLAGIASSTASTTATNCVAPVNARPSAPALRALFAALDEWTAKGVAPPAARAPLDGDLAPAQDLKWPKIPGLPAPPEGARRVPRIDADGNETSGLRLPDVALPVATFTGFNAQKDKKGPPCAAGAAIPFAATKVDREKNADPRPALVERYGSRAYFVATMRVIADKLVKERLLLQQDADAYVAAARSAPF